ncbi:MAG: hypothetical protein EXR53_00530 [Dehalococcoidia bacterium]|nr:hypothetical protein [Dehalococcoidia bacterium]
MILEPMMFLASSSFLPVGVILPIVLSEARGDPFRPLFGPGVVVLYIVVTCGGMLFWIANRKTPAIKRWGWILLPLGAGGVVTTTLALVLLVLVIVSFLAWGNTLNKY